ncbi:HI0074 family nucleotidyltransferase substrate-binding subunit [Acidocella sp.]|uniref:HI0074 family nucleotidyltransferase substrate-binding subunit n=1 Tax=Acidocella sp. TaxID=50710 RepID=UPI0026272690|nr:HI0074 family nucleotidyltransferase substrate-binding subunit [Acidocella sp.]MDD2795503.1 HI0074 family nucleotidyltransferase substrate-binding subunit [Acidocella sp.]
MIDTSSLEQALATLDEALAALARAPQDGFIRDACIQRFEYTYELSHKMLRRYLEASEPAGSREMSFPSLIRLGFERGLLAQSWDVWTIFRDARNATSHAYNETKARDVAGKIPNFAAAAHFLAQQIKARQP